MRKDSFYLLIILFWAIILLVALLNETGIKETIKEHDIDLSTIFWQ